MISLLADDLHRLFEDNRGDPTHDRDVKAVVDACAPRGRPVEDFLLRELELTAVYDHAGDEAVGDGGALVADADFDALRRIARELVELLYEVVAGEGSDRVIDCRRQLSSARTLRRERHVAAPVGKLVFAGGRWELLRVRHADLDASARGRSRRGTTTTNQRQTNERSTHCSEVDDANVAAAIGNHREL